MRIAFVTQPWDIAFSGEGGGGSIPILSYQMALRLVEQGHQIDIFARQADGQPAQETDEHGITFHRIPLSFDDLLQKPIKVYDRQIRFRDRKRPAFATNLYYRRYGIAVGRKLRVINPDVIHIHNFSQFVPLFKQFAKNAKLVLHMHCEWLSQLDPSLIKKRLKDTDLILGCSDFITQETAQKYPEYANRCKTLFNGVNIDSLPKSLPEKKSQTILYVGRLSPEKGVHTLIEAFKIVAKRFPEVRLDLAGAGGSAPFEFLVALSDDPRVRALDRFYGSGLIKSDLGGYVAYLKNLVPPDLTNRISFLGFVQHHNLEAHYRNADILVNPSLSEAFGMSLVEAMAQGTPVIASKIGGMLDIVVDGETGVLVAPDDPDALATGIIQLLQNDALRAAMGARGQALVQQQFSWEIVTDSLLASYRANLTDCV